MIASIIDDSRLGMSDVAFRIAPPIGGPSCLTVEFIACSMIANSIYSQTFIFCHDSVWNTVFKRNAHAFSLNASAAAAAVVVTNFKKYIGNY